MRRAVATKSMALCCLLLAAAGCSQQQQKKAAEQVAVTERSPEQICASADNRQSVKAIIVREAKEEAPGSETVGDEVLASYLTIGPVVVELVDEATDRVTCSTDVSFSIPADLRGYYVQAAILANYLQRNGHAAWAASNGVDMGEEVPGELMKGNGGAVPITFSVQPTADRKSELVSVEGAGGLISAVATAAKALIAQGQVGQVSRSEGEPTVASQPIDACYRLESCTYWKVISVARIRQEGSSRLLKALLQPGEVKNPAGTPEDNKRIVWSGSPKTIYAYCSTSAPRIAWQVGAKYAAEEFDFAGEGISGVQQNSANVYQAICHGFYNNELVDKAKSLGYNPLPDGGLSEFEIDSPVQLATSQ